MIKKHILVIEDDTEIRKLLKRFLSINGYIVSAVQNLKKSHEIIDYFKFDLIILDIMLPDGTGFEFVKKYKDSLNIPIIILSAMGHTDDKIHGLENGAKDYITKPFEPRELLARIKNLIINNVKNEILSFGNFEFNFKSKILCSNGKIIKLTQSERNLLEIFCNNPGSIISRVQLQQAFNELNFRTIDTMITRLRSKIEMNPKSPRFIITERNQGYSFWP